MKKLLYALALTTAVTLGTAALADTITGKVVDTDGDTITVQQKNGKEKKLTATPDTTYRKKKILKKDKMRHGHRMHKGDAYYKPLLEEDDWVEIIYTPTPDNDWIIEDVTVYDD